MENPSSGMLWFLALILSLDKLSHYLSVRHREVDVMLPKACFGCWFCFLFLFFFS